MYDYTLFICLYCNRSDILQQMKWAVSLVFTVGHVNLPQGFVWSCMGKHTHFITSVGVYIRILCNRNHDIDVYSSSSALWVKYPDVWQR